MPPKKLPKKSKRQTTTEDQKPDAEGVEPQTDSADADVVLNIADTERLSEDTKASSGEEKTPSSEETAAPEPKSDTASKLREVDELFAKPEFDAKEDLEWVKRILQSGLFHLLREPDLDDDEHYEEIAKWLYAYKKVANHVAKKGPLLNMRNNIEWQDLSARGKVFAVAEAKAVGDDEDDVQDPVDVATNRKSFMHAVVLFEFEDSFTESKTYPRFRSLTHFEWEAVARALCFMFHQSVENTLARIATYLIFLQNEARICIEDDVEHGEWMIRLGGQMQQAAVVMVELLSDGSQEALWCSNKGMATLLYLQLADARLFFARPKLQQIMFDVWRGLRSDASSRGMFKKLWCWVWLGCGSVVNLIVLPAWAALPTIERRMSQYQLARANEARAETIQWIQEAHDKEGCQLKVLEEINKTSDELFKKDQIIRIGKQRYWSKAAYRKAVVEKCRDAVFGVERWIPLLIPRHKRYLAILTNLLFAAYLAWEPPGEAQTWNVLLLSSGAWCTEVIQLLGVSNVKDTTLRQLSPVFSPEFNFWFMDRVNIMELIAFSCVVWSCLVVLFDVERTEFAQQFKAVGVLFMGISQTMSMLRMSSIFGPLVSMTMNMIVDMIQWVLLLIPIIGCIVASLMTLFKSRPEHAEMLDDDCQSFSGVNGSFADSLLFFMEVQIGREPPLECLHNSRHTFVGPIILNFGLWVVLILMLNMLIAMMAKTFDRIYERSMIDFQYNFIAAVLQTVEEPAVPPVLRMLSVPWRIVELAMSASDANNCIKVHEDICKKVKDDKFTSTQLEHADNIRKSRFKKLHKEQTAEFDDEQKEPNPPAEQKDPEGLQTLDILYKAVQEFVAEHISDAAIQEEIWRKQFAKQLFATDNRVKAVQSALRSEENEELEQLRARCRELEVVNRVQSALSSRDNKELEQLRARCQELEDARPKAAARMGDAKK